MRFLRTNTAVRITVGPFLDKTDGVTEETGLTPTNMHIVFTTDDDDGTAVNTRIDTTLTASSGDNDIVHIAHGMWDLELTAAQTNYLGRAFLYIGDYANHCPVFHEFMILPQKVYDSLVAGSDNLEVDTIQWLGTACATPNTNGVPKVDTTKVAGTDQTAGDLKATLTNMSGATFNTATDSLEAIRDRGDAAWTSGTAQAISYAPTSVAYTIGDDESGGGTFAKLASHDDDYLQCGENATTGLEFQVLATVTGKQTENPSLVRISAFYSGSATHELTIQVYNYTSAAWNDAATMKDRTTFFDYVVPLDSDNHDPANGSMKIRFKHNTATYNAAHYLRVDYVSFEKRTVTDALASDVAQILAMVNDIDTEVDSLANDGVKLGDVAHGGSNATLELSAAPQIGARYMATEDGIGSIETGIVKAVEGAGLLYNNYIAVEYWDGSQSDVITASYSENVGSGNTIILKGYDFGTTTTFGYVDDTGFHKDAGWTTFGGMRLTMEINRSGAAPFPAGVLTLTINRSVIGTTPIVFTINLPPVSTDVSGAHLDILSDGTVCALQAGHISQASSGSGGGVY